MVFIFGNSMMDAVDSNSESKFLTAFVQYILALLGFHWRISIIVLFYCALYGFQSSVTTQQPQCIFVPPTIDQPPGTSWLKHPLELSHICAQNIKK